MRLLLCIIFMGVFYAIPAQAADDEAEDTPSVHYVDVEPAIVANFGEKGRIKYVRTLITLKVGNADAEKKATLHLPSLRNALVMLLSEQNRDSVNSAPGKEFIRQQALERLQATMKELEGVNIIEDVYFKTFVVQN